MAAGCGPRVTQLDASLAQLRRLAELHSITDDVDLRWSTVRAEASMLAAQARHTNLEASQVSWFRPGRRDRLLVQAAELTARSQRALALAEQLGQLRAKLDHKTGGHHLGSTQGPETNSRAPKRATPRDLDRAHHGDLADLAALRHQVSMHTGAAETTGHRHDELTAEQQLRAEMPPQQAIAEQNLRISASNGSANSKTALPSNKDKRSRTHATTTTTTTTAGTTVRASVLAYRSRWRLPPFTGIGRIISKSHPSSMANLRGDPLPRAEPSLRDGARATIDNRHSRRTRLRIG